MAELLAPVIAIRSHPEAFRDRAATYFVDNLSAVSAMVCGASRASDLSKMGLAFSAMSHDLGSPYWVEWVPSASNAADDGSRLGAAETTARSLGIPMAESSFDSLCLTNLLGLTPAQIVHLLLG